MRLSKMLGLTALAALAVMAIAGAGTAFAKGAGHDTVLCKANQHPCEAANIYPKETPILAESTNTVLKVTLLGTQEVVCENSTVEGFTHEAKGQKGTSETELEGQITNLTFTGKCHVKSNGAACTVHSSNTDEVFKQLPYQALLEQEEVNTGKGHLFVFSGGKGQPGAIVECGGLLPINCIYKGAETSPQQAGEGVNLQVEGGNPAHVVANQAQLKEVSEAPHNTCTGSEPKWSGTYTVVEPAPVWVSHA